MRSVIAILSFFFGGLTVAAVAYAVHASWQELWFYQLNLLSLGLFARFLAVTVLVVAASAMVLGGIAMLAGCQWSMRLVNRSATGTALAILCYCSLAAYQTVADNQKVVAGRVLVELWLPGLAVAALPVFIVWWTERHFNVPIEQLSWKWRREQRRGMRMAGRCHHCGAMVNFVSGEGVRRPADEPFALYCDNCGEKLDLRDTT